MNACIRLCGKVKMSALFNLINVMGNYRASQRAADATLREIAGKNRTELNTEEAPTAMSIRQSSWARDANVLVIPPLSFTMIDIVV